MSDPLDSVLVVGGCGFVGYHVVRHFLLEPSCTSVSVISRNPRGNRLPRVSYYAGDITNVDEIRDLVSEIRPSVIVHAASPSAISATASDYENVTIQGTRNLLLVASEVPSVKVFIYTSSATMAAGSEHIDLDETTRLADTDPQSHPYAKTKARADKMVLAANRDSNQEGSRSKLRTGCLRLPLVYGERDQNSIPGALAALEKGQANFQLGDGSNVWDFVSADNVGVAHVLLAKALLAHDVAASKVDGEAFNITDGERRLFWDFPRAVWEAAGHKTERERVWVLPTWVALVVADVLEWLFWILTFGTKRPTKLGRQQIEYTCLTHTYSINKATERLGYKPVSEFHEGIRRAVAWSLDEGGWSLRLRKIHRSS